MADRCLQDYTHKIKLEGKKSFSRASREVFHVKSCDVGELQHIMLRKDDAGMGSDWHLKAIEVSHYALGKRYVFNPAEWLKGIVEKKYVPTKVTEAMGGSSHSGSLPPSPTSSVPATPRSGMQGSQAGSPRSVAGDAPSP